MARKFVSTGSITTEPGKLGEWDTAESKMDLAFSLLLRSESSAVHLVVNAIDGSPQQVASDIANIQLLVLKLVSGGPLKCYLTSSLGAIQVVPLSGQITIQTGPTDPITAVRISGVGVVAYIAAGF